LFREAAGARLTYASATVARAAIEQADLQGAGPAAARRAAGRSAAAATGLLSRRRAVLRRRRRRQGRDRQPAARVDGPALAAYARLWRALRRGARAAGTLALLARPAAEGPDWHPHQRVVRRADRPACSSGGDGHGVPARASGNRAPRATAHRRRRAHPEVHDAPRA